MKFQEKDFLEKNLNAAKQQVLAKQLPPPPKQLLAKNGEVTVKIAGQMLASGVFPSAEGKKFLATLPQGSKQLLLYGLGLGYHMPEVPMGVEQLIIVELNQNILSAALHHKNLSQLLSDKRVQLITGSSEQELASKLASAGFTKNRWSVVVHLPSYRMMPEGFGKMREMIEAELGDRRFHAMFYKIEQKNVKMNMEAVVSSAGIKQLLPFLKNRTCVLVGAGPSLDRSLPLLKLLAGRAFILTADTAIRPLLAAGIKPDCVVSVDGQFKSAYHFCGVKHEMPLLFLPTSSPSVVRQHVGNRLVMIAKGNSVTTPIEEKLAAKGIINAGGSVSCFGLQLLAEAGANCITFAGQDFGFPAGTAYNRQTLEDMSGGRMQNGISDVIRDHHDSRQLKMFAGRDGTTHDNLLEYLRSFEAIVAAHEDIKFYNLNSAGAVVKGCKNILTAGELEQLIPANKPMPVTIPEEVPDVELAKQLTSMI